MPKAWLIGGGVFLAALLIASVVVALLEREEPLTGGTPEAAVQRYLEAVEDEKLELAFSFLSADLMEHCTVEEFFRPSGAPLGRMRDDRVTLENVKTVNQTVFVTVRVTTFHGTGPFGSSESLHVQRFSLRQEEGEWRFTEYPWPFFRCGPFKPERERTIIPHPPEPVVTPVP